MFYDYHMHSNFSPDSKAPMEKMIEKSIELGLKEICFTDHMDYDVNQTDKFVVNYEEYLHKLNLMQEKYKDKISIKKGIELGLQPHLVDIYSKDIKSHNFDFVICSQHAINKDDLYCGKFFEDKSQFESYEKYYTELYEVVKKYDDYSVLGHLDLIKRYCKYDKLLDDNLFLDILESIFKEIIYKGKGIEINTSCFRYNLPDLTPSKQIIKLYKDLGGEIITTGSDSHDPSYISCHFNYIYSYLNEIDFKYICKFDSMNPSFIKI